MSRGFPHEGLSVPHDSVLAMHRLAPPGAASKLCKARGFEAYISWYRGHLHRSSVSRRYQARSSVAAIEVDKSRQVLSVLWNPRKILSAVSLDHQNHN